MSSEERLVQCVAEELRILKHNVSEELADLRKRIDAIGLVVTSLPHTADGVLVYPPMTIYCLWRGREKAVRIEGIVRRSGRWYGKSAIEDPNDDYPCEVELSDCYTTEESLLETPTSKILLHQYQLARRLDDAVRKGVPLQDVSLDAPIP